MNPMIKDELYEFRLKITSWKLNFDNWRKEYDNLSYSQQQAFYTQMVKDHPDQSQHNKEVVSYFLNSIDAPYLSVLEMGGWNGELAQDMLFKHPNILRWDNYEITHYAQEWSICKDSRYSVNIPNDFIWNIVLPEHYNIFLSSHTIEHIKGKDFITLIENLPQTIQYIYLEAPISLSSTNRDWTGDFSTHILELGWKQITEILKEKGFERYVASKHVRTYRKIEEFK